MLHLRLRPALAAAAVTVAAGATLAAATGGGSTPSLSALSDYTLFHGSLGHAALEEPATTYKAPGMGVTPDAPCGPGSRPETSRQGRAPLADYKSGRAAKGYTCNVTDVGHEGDSGGFQVHRYVDKAGHE